MVDKTKNETITCPVCSGTGLLNNKPCKKCKGSGNINERDVSSKLLNEGN